MPPARSRPLDESKHDGASHARERYPNTTTTAAGNGRVKKNAAAAANKDSGNALGSVGDSGSGNMGALNWLTTPTSLLHLYRHTYNLPTPSSFHRNVAEAALTNPHGIGRQSPTMLHRRARGRRRGRSSSSSSSSSSKASKEQLAFAVRKHFNDLAVNETEVVTEFLYAVRARDKALRQRFGQQKVK